MENINEPSNKHTTKARSKRTVEQKKADILKHLRHSYGILTIACKRANVGRTMCYEYLKDQCFKDAVDEINENYISYVETRLYDLIRAGDKSAIIFFLKAKAKHKGYK